MEKAINVLSLFDGCSGGRQALERTGVKVNQYYASEIDKYAIKVTQANYPNTIQLGSVVNVDVSKLPKIDLLIGGSPCQSFSFAGKRKGMSTKCETEILTLSQYLQLKKEGFEFEGQSFLFWEYMRILTEIRQVNPDVKFLLENVEMGEKWEKVLSKAIGVNGVHINSALVSAQNRKRIYWCNFGVTTTDLFGETIYSIPQPSDKGILLKDILEIEVDEKYYLSETFINWLEKHSLKRGNEFKKTIGDRKSSCLTVSALKSVNLSSDFIVANGAKEQVVGRKAQKDGTYKREYEISNDQKAKTLETNKHKNNVAISDKIMCIGGLQKNATTYIDKSTPMVSAMGMGGGHIPIVNPNQLLRRLTPIECERLQTVKDNYTNHVSDSQRYKMLGNGWTIDVICHILQFLTD